MTNSVDHAGVRDRLIAILFDLDVLGEPVAAVHVNQALEIVLAQAPL